MSGDAIPCPGCGRATSARKKTTLCTRCATGGKIGKRGRPMIEAEPREVLSASVNRRTKAAFGKGKAAKLLMIVADSTGGRSLTDEELERIKTALGAPN